MRRYMVVVVMALLCVLGAQAQDTIEVIPVDSVGYMMAMSPDGRFIATAELGAIHNDEILPEYLPIRLFDAPSGEALFTFEGASDYASSLAFSPDGSTLVTHHNVGWLYVWDTNTGERIQEIPALPEGGRIFYMPDGAHLLQAFNYLRPTLLQWDVANSAITAALLDRFNTRQEMQELSTVARIDYILDAVILDDNQTAITSTTMNDIIQWDLNTGEQTYLLDDEVEIPNFDIRHIALSQDESSLFYIHSRNGTVNVIDLATGEESTIFESDDNIYALGSASEADVLAWVAGERESPVLYITSLADPSAMTELPLVSDDGSYGDVTAVVEVALSPDGTQIFVGGFFNTEGENVILKITL